MLRIRQNFIWIAICAALLIGVASIGSRPAAIGAQKEAENSMELTIYNSDLALVKETRTMEIPEGLSRVLFPDISARINPATVSFVSLTSPADVRVREQNYEYDLVEETKLMQRFIGEKISVTTKGGRNYTGYLLSGARFVAFQHHHVGRAERHVQVFTVQLSDVQSVEYPSLPEGLITRPTLAWLIANSSGESKHDCLVTYLTGGLSWAADYVATIGPNDDSLDLRGWVTVTNESGATFRDAKLKLVAGDVHQVREEMYDAVRATSKVLELGSAPSFEEKSFFEYHLYTLQFPTTLKESQIKQIELLTADSIPAKKLLVYDGARQGTKVTTMLEFWNKQENNLGMPLPKGIMRVSYTVTDGRLEFIGEDRIDHPPTDEKVRIELGSAFDVVGERSVMGTRRLSDRVNEQTFKIEVRNHKEEPVEVTILEHLSAWAEWEIVSATAKWNKLDGSTIEFPTKIPANGSVSITYTVRYNY